MILTCTGANRGGKVRWWLIVAIAAAALVAYALVPRPVEVSVWNVRESPLSLELSSTGLVEAHLVDLNPQITAKITTLYAQEGDTVGKGQAVAQLEDTDLLADVSRARAAVETARREADAAYKGADADETSARAGVERARAMLKSAEARLRELESGSRSEDIAAQKAAVDQAKARAEDARKRHERAEALLKQGAISVQERDTAKATLDAAEAEVRAQEEQLRKLQQGPRRETIDAARSEKNAAQAALGEARAALGAVAVKRKQAQAALARLAQAQADVERANAQLSYATLRSPLRGVVARKHKEAGEVVTPLDPVYTLASLDSMWVTAEVDEENAAAVRLGQQVKITLDAYPGQTIRGTVVRVSRIAEPKEVGRVRAKIVRAKIVLRPTLIPLRPGTEVNITGRAGAGKRALTVPNDAIVRVGDSDAVYVIAQGKARLREVRTGQSNFDFTQVLSGLRQGERVAVTSVDQLTDGLGVRIIRVLASDRNTDSTDSH